MYLYIRQIFILHSFIFSFSCYVECTAFMKATRITVVHLHSIMAHTHSHTSTCIHIHVHVHIHTHTHSNMFIQELDYVVLKNISYVEIENNIKMYIIYTLNITASHLMEVNYCMKNVSMF